IDGIVYSSSRHAGGRAFVAFCENEQCVDGEPGPAFLEPLMRLVGVEHRPCPEGSAPAPVILKGLAALMNLKGSKPALHHGDSS
uniref:hypothetical protein n=1 Tax=Klebsiella pneumoniae TaxID=573 RepID=UPI0019542E8C